MRHRQDRRSSAISMGCSATPLVDLIFTLSMFYMLVAKFSAEEQTPMLLPKPEASLASVSKVPERIVINCRLADPLDTEESPVAYSIGPNLPEPLEVISDRLAAMKAQAPGVNVVIRADRRLRYEDVRAMMRVVARNGIEMLNVVALAGEEQ